MPDELEDRLQKHARSFDGLLSLIPAKLYYGEDVSDQWKRKKQTPEQKREAKKQKLDPDNWKSAKDVMDEREAAAAKKRKRDDDKDTSDLDITDLEPPKADANVNERKPKKQKTDKAQANTPNPQETDEDRMRRKREARIAKRERKREKKLKVKEKVDRSKARKQAEKATKNPDKPKTKTADQRQQQKPSSSESKEDGSDDGQAGQDMAEEIDIHHPSTTFSTQLQADDSASEASAADQVEVFSPPQESGVSSSSSIQPAAEEVVKPKPEQSTTAPSAPPKERLANAIAAFRTQRKADTDGGPKSRAELLDQRRKQEERRRVEKKEQKRIEKEEAQRQQEAEIAARFSPGGSGSLLNSPRSPMSITDNGEPNNFSYGRIAFDDGSKFDPNTSLDMNGDVVEQRKMKGPSDAATALSAAMKKKSRLSGLDEEKQSRIASQDMWSAAKKRASGEKVKDDTSLLKKALKRQDGQKKKSEKEWGDRKEGIDKSMAARQKKRTDNLAKRKDEKGGKKGKGKSRPGFEGSFKGRTGGKKKGKA